MSKYDPRPTREGPRSPQSAPPPLPSRPAGPSRRMVTGLVVLLLFMTGLSTVFGFILAWGFAFGESREVVVVYEEPVTERPVPPGAERGPVVPAETPSAPPQPIVRYVSKDMPDLLPPAQGPARFAGDHVAVQLPGTYRTFCVGASGRYLIAHVPDADQVVIIDVLEGGIVHAIEGVSDDVIPAAGRNWLVLVKPGQRLIERIRLDNFERDKVAPLPGDGTTRKALMGYLSDGPLLVASNDAHLIDLPTLTPIDAGHVIGSQGKYGHTLHVAADGRSFAGIPMGYGPVSYSFLRLTPVGTVKRNFSSTSQANRHAAPNADGSLVFQDGHGVYSGDLRHLPTEYLKGRTMFPTDDPRYFIALQHAKTSTGDNGVAMDVATNADRRVVLTKVGFTELGQRGNTNESSSRGRFLWLSEGEFHYFVHLQVFAATDWDRQRIHLYKVNLVDELNATGIDYLYVESTPPYIATRGTQLRYPITTRSKIGGVKLTLASAPDGTSLDADGVLAWDVPRDYPNKTASFIVEAADSSGQSILHAFEVGVQ